MTEAGGGVEPKRGVTGGTDTACGFGAAAPAGGATDGAGMPISVALVDTARGEVLGAAGGLDVIGRGGLVVSGRGAFALGAGRGGADEGRDGTDDGRAGIGDGRDGLDGRGGFDEARGALELGAGRGGTLTTLLGGVLAGFSGVACADCAGVLLARAGGVLLARAGGALLGTGAAGSSPQASSTSSSFSLSLIPSRL